MGEQKERPHALRGLTWEHFGTTTYAPYPHVGTRLRVPGGWLVHIGFDEDVPPVFVPDPDHSWDAQHAAYMAQQRGEVAP